MLATLFKKDRFPNLVLWLKLVGQNPLYLRVILLRALCKFTALQADVSWADHEEAHLLTTHCSRPQPRTAHAS